MFEARVGDEDIQVKNDIGFGEVLINSGVSINYIPKSSYNTIIN